MRSGVRYDKIWAEHIDTHYKEQEITSANIHGVALRKATSAVVDISTLTINNDNWMKRHPTFKVGARFIGMQY